MELIIKGRGKGKTTELINRSAETQTYILTVNTQRARDIFLKAREMDVYIPYPVTIDEYFSTHGFTGSFIKSVYIDDADDVLKHIFCRVGIEAITMTNKEDEKMELRNEEKGYLENDKESVLETAQNIIADESFQYGGNSLTVLEIINAIKDGYRLANLAEVDRRICDAFDKGFEEGLRASKKTDDKPLCDAFDKGFEEGIKAASKKNDKPIFS